MKPDAYSSTSAGCDDVCNVTGVKRGTVSPFNGARGVSAAIDSVPDTTCSVVRDQYMGRIVGAEMAGYSTNVSDSTGDQ